NGRCAQELCQWPGVQRSGTAKGHQGKALRIISLLHGDDAQGSYHVVIDDLYDTGCRLIKIKTEGHRHMVVDGLTGTLQVERHLTPKQRRWDAAQHQMGIRHGGGCTTLVIAGWPWHGPGALRPDRQTTQGRHRSDTAPTSATR